jgi:ribosomal protein S18 acetylase RimI-like enzyme
MTSTISSVPQVRSGTDPLLDRAVGSDSQAPANRAGSVLADFETTAHRLFADASFDDTVAEVTALAALRYGAGGAGVILVRRGGTPFPVGDHHPAVSRVDGLQVSGRQGPALQAIDRRQPVIVCDLRSENRWRLWAPLAADAGFRSVLSLPLAHGDVVGALTLYSTSLSQFQPSVLASAGVFAHLASIAVAVAQERQQFGEAVTSHAVVGQAKGILMERFGITADQAFAVLRRYSSHRNQKLRVIAEAVIQERRLPKADPATRDPLSPRPRPTPTPADDAEVTLRV